MCLKLARFIACCLVGVLPCVLLSGCLSSGGDRAELPRPLEITLGATMRVNPTVTGRASPIFVRLFELSDSARFLGADYLELAGQSAGTLEGDVLASEEYNLLPGETRVVRKDAASKSKFIGIVAGYRDPANSTWRAVVPLPEPYLAGRLWTSNRGPLWRQTFVLDEKGVITGEDVPKTGASGK